MASIFNADDDHVAEWEHLQGALKKKVESGLVDWQLSGISDKLLLCHQHQDPTIKLPHACLILEILRAENVNQNLAEIVKFMVKSEDNGVAQQWCCTAIHALLMHTGPENVARKDCKDLEDALTAVS